MSSSKKKVIFLLFIAFRSAFSEGYQCCGFNEMDASGRVLVEVARILPQGEYQAVKFRSCATQMIAIQLWNCDLANSYCAFRWQTVAQTMSIDQTINFSPQIIGLNDRLGIFTTANSTSQLAIPFGNDPLALLYTSQSRYSDANGFMSGSRINFDENDFLTRSFALSVVFCKNKDCTDLSSNALAPSTLIRNSAYQPPIGQCCANQLTCNSSSLNNLVEQNNIVIKNLQNQINILNQLIITLTDQTRPVTGICPQGFTAGTYGLGTCYAAFYNPLSFGAASFYCRDNFVANLVSINSLMEQQFLTYFIGNQVRGLGHFWTSGMYQFSDSTWYWYDKRDESLQYQYYSNWENNVVPLPTSLDDVCSNLVVTNPSNRTAYWIGANCNNPHFFICEIAKICF